MKITQEALFKIQSELEAIRISNNEIDATIDELKLKKANLAEQEKKVKQELIVAMQENGQSKAEFDFVVAKIKKPAQVVSIIKKDKIDKKFIKVKETESIDKNAIKKALKAGEKVEGAELTDGVASVTIEAIDPE